MMHQSHHLLLLLLRCLLLFVLCAGQHVHPSLCKMPRDPQGVWWQANFLLPEQQKHELLYRAGSVCAGQRQCCSCVLGLLALHMSHVLLVHTHAQSTGCGSGTGCMQPNRQGVLRPCLKGCTSVPT